MKKIFNLGGSVFSRFFDYTRPITAQNLAVITIAASALYIVSKYFQSAQSDSRTQLSPPRPTSPDPLNNIPAETFAASVINQQLPSSASSVDQTSNSHHSVPQKTGCQLFFIEESLPSLPNLLDDVPIETPVECNVDYFAQLVSMSKKRTLHKGPPPFQINTEKKLMTIEELVGSAKNVENARKGTQFYCEYALRFASENQIRSLAFPVEIVNVSVGNERIERKQLLPWIRTAIENYALKKNPDSFDKIVLY